MLDPFRRLGTRGVAAAAAVAVIAGATAALAGLDPDAPGTASGAVSSPCGRSSAATIAAVDAVAARRIYASELHGSETRLDVGRITHSTALLNALAGSNDAAVRSAVHGLVYAPHWHIVRLRVISSGRVISDIGGPYIIAPVTGALRSHGKLVGRYVMSVQDDVGYVKLVTRFIGVPLELYRNGLPLMGTVNHPPASIPKGSTVTAGSREYLPMVLNMHAFPKGDLQVALMLPQPAAALTQESCSAVRVDAWGSIAEHVAARFKPLSAHYQDLVDVLRAITGYPAYVTSGSRRIAGGRGPSRLPSRGAVAYAGRSWSVFSWESEPSVRVYLLTPPA
jgi:hypothetical protein